MSETTHIRIVDDEPNVGLVFRTALESAGHGVTEADNGQSSLEELGQTPVNMDDV